MKDVQISTPEVLIVAQRESEMLSTKDAGPKTWAEQDLRRLIDSTVARKAIPHTPRYLARKSLRDQRSSPFTQRIADVPPSKKFYAPKFNIYNGRLDPANHVRYYQQVMVYWFSNNAVMCTIFPTSFGDAVLKWFTRLPVGQIDNFRELTEQFTIRFITNSRVVKGPEALTNMKKRKNETICEYSFRYWETYQKTKDCDLKFALDTFKYGLPKDRNGIYNSLTRVPPYTFKELLSRSTKTCW